MQDKLHLKREGDINNSPLRMNWLNQLNPTSIEKIKADERIFIKQSMSTPCLTGIIDADGCYLTDVNGKKYLDFHGNSSHQVGYRRRKRPQSLYQLNEIYDRTPARSSWRR